jgi:hypothetical protein
VPAPVPAPVPASVVAVSGPESEMEVLKRKLAEVTEELALHNNKRGTIEQQDRVLSSSGSSFNEEVRGVNKTLFTTPNPSNIQVLYTY